MTPSKTNKTKENAHPEKDVRSFFYTASNWLLYSVA